MTSIHPDDICNTCTFELTPERICHRDHCPHTFMKRTGKPLTMEHVNDQIASFFQPKPAAKPEELDFRGFFVPGADGTMKIVRDEHGPVITSKRDVTSKLLRDAMTKPEAEQDAGHVVLTREQADWLKMNTPYIRYGISSRFGGNVVKTEDLDRLDEIEQALK